MRKPSHPLRKSTIFQWNQYEMKSMHVNISNFFLIYTTCLQRLFYMFLKLFIYQKKIGPIFEKIFAATMKMFMYHKSSCIPFLNPRTPHNVEQEIIDFRTCLGGFSRFIVSATLFGVRGLEDSRWKEQHFVLHQKKVAFFYAERVRC